MNTMIHVLIDAILLGFTATIIFDVWILLQKSFGLPTLNFAYLGRWVANFKDKKFKHTAIKSVPKVKFERLIGIVAHYLIGAFIAALLLAMNGTPWLQNPDIYSAIIVGIATVVFPLFIMQPAMGAGMAFRNTPNPVKNSLKSTLNHMVFGLCLYWSGLLLMQVQGLNY